MNKVYRPVTDLTRLKLINHIHIIWKSQIDYNIIDNLDLTLSKMNLYIFKVWRPEIRPDPNIIKKNLTQPDPTRNNLKPETTRYQMT
jgi:hypothetical protein